MKVNCINNCYQPKPRCKSILKRETKKSKRKRHNEDKEKELKKQTCKTS